LFDLDFREIKISIVFQNQNDRIQPVQSDSSLGPKERPGVDQLCSSHSPGNAGEVPDHVRSNHQ